MEMISMNFYHTVLAVSILVSKVLFVYLFHKT